MPHGPCEVKGVFLGAGVEIPMSSYCALLRRCARKNYKTKKETFGTCLRLVVVVCDRGQTVLGRRALAPPGRLNTMCLTRRPPLFPHSMFLVYCSLNHVLEATGYRGVRTREYLVFAKATHSHLWFSYRGTPHKSNHFTASSSLRQAIAVCCKRTNVESSLLEAIYFGNV